MGHQQTMHWTNEEWTWIESTAKARNISASRVVKDLIATQYHTSDQP